MVQPFEDALFAMQPGDVSEPVKTDFGWHVIKLREVRSGQQTSFEEARAQLEGEQAEVARERAFNELTGKLVDQALKNPSALRTEEQTSELQSLMRRSYAVLGLI